MENSDEQNKNSDPQQNSMPSAPLSDNQPPVEKSCKKEKCPGDDQIAAFKKIYFYKSHINNKGSNGGCCEGEDDSEGEDNEDYVEKRKVLMGMATAYREMIDIENRLVYNRTYILVYVNGFLIAASGFLVGTDKCNFWVKILVLILFAILGIGSAIRYAIEINKCCRATWYLRERWRKFLEKFYPCADKKIHLIRDYTLPPMIGLSASDELDEVYSTVTSCPPLFTSCPHWVDEYKCEKLFLRLYRFLYRVTRFENLLFSDYNGLCV